ncbi:hypothetical protein FRC00_008453, partial [Tulasnella sp. 408]
MPVDKPPLSDEPSHSEELKATSPEPDRSTAEPTPQMFEWDKLHFLNGQPTQAFRDWQDVKDGRFDLPWDGVDYNWHDDDELLGCWSIYQTFNGAKTPLDREMPHFLHLDVQYTAVPLVVELTGTEGGHTSFKGLAHLLSSTGRSEALSTQPPLPTYGKRPLPPTTPHPEPDDQLACFDNLYWVWSEEVWEWGKYPSPTWHSVGVHMHFTKEVDEIATGYLQRVFGLREDEQVPP